MVQLAPGDAAFHDSVTLLLVLLGDVSPVGMLGSMLQLPAGSVVTDSAALWAEALPALSRARTRKLNDVFAARPVAGKLVPVGIERGRHPLRSARAADCLRSSVESRRQQREQTCESQYPPLFRHVRSFFGEGPARTNMQPGQYQRDTNRRDRVTERRVLCRP